ncbi:hypothetical protein PLESTM_000170300 [Pleodorina starrii]|nr:hypothetical protein PLESTM_000170300 [Pleodorina starrii]
MFVVQGLSWFAGLAHGMGAGPTHGSHGRMGPESNADEDSFGPKYDELLASLGEHHDGARKLLSAFKAGPLPGLTFIPGFPGGGGPVRQTAAAAEAAFAQYVVSGQDPVAIALRQLSIAAIGAMGTAVQNQIARAIRNIDAELERYEEYVGRVADSLSDSNVPNLLASLQREVRVLVIVRAALEDMGARWSVYVSFLTEAASSWTSFYYNYQFRFRVMLLALLSSNDPFGLEYVRVLYSLADVTKLVGLVLKPFLDLQEFEQNFYNALNDIIFAYANDERNRLTITPSLSLPWAPGTGGNLQVAIERVLNVAEALGSNENTAALLQAASAARDRVAAALRRPNADGSSNVAGLFRRMQQSWGEAAEEGADGFAGVGGLGAGLAGMQGLGSMAGLADGAANANFFGVASG